MKKGMTRMTVVLTPAQYAALREEALKRALKKGGAADASAIIRELVDAWLARRKS